MKNNEQSRTFEASLEALEQIVRELEQGDLPLEKSLELFEQGIRLSRECQERLSQAERRIEILLKDNQGRTIVSTFEEANGLDQEAQKTQKAQEGVQDRPQYEIDAHAVREKTARLRSLRLTKETTET